MKTLTELLQEAFAEDQRFNPELTKEMSGDSIVLDSTYPANKDGHPLDSMLLASVDEDEDPTLDVEELVIVKPNNETAGEPRIRYIKTRVDGVKKSEKYLVAEIVKKALELAE